MAVESDPVNAPEAHEAHEAYDATARCRIEAPLHD
jgi:hypothetical protein